MYFTFTCIALCFVHHSYRFAWCYLQYYVDHSLHTRQVTPCFPRFWFLYEFISGWAAWSCLLCFCFGCFWKVLSFELWLWGAAVCHLPREMLYVKPLYLYTQDLDLTFKHNIWLAILVLWIGWRCVVCCVLCVGGGCGDFSRGATQPESLG